MIAQSLQWVMRILAVAVVMVAPGIGGNWLDRRWGTEFFALAGFALGLVCGVLYLVLITRGPTPTHWQDDEDENGS